MSRVLLVVLVLAGGAALAAWAARRERAFEPRYEGRPPNVLLLSVDTLRADHMGVYGYERDTTPRIDAWAEGAVVFEDAQASASWTLPGLASVLTSTFSSTHGCWTFSSRLAPSFTTLPELLRDAGYDTMAVTSHVFLARRYGLQQGFVHFDDEFAHPELDQTTNVTSHEVSDKGIAFLEHKAAADDGAPWLLWLHYFDPHGAYVPHEGITERFGTDEVAHYDGEIAYTDLHVGRVLERLEELGLADDTVVVFLSDHGEEFGDHGGSRHGHSLHRELVRVPLLVSGPGFPPRRVERRVRTVDLLPTVLDLVPPLAPPPEAEGESLLPLLRGEADAGADPRALPALAEIRLEEARSFDSVVDGRWKLIVDVMTGDVELYDVVLDPLETRDVAAEHPEEVERLKRTLERLVRRAQDRGARHGTSEALDLTPAQLEQMRGLGYLGGE